MKKEITYLLFESGITNYKIAQATGVSQVVLGKYTNGKSDIGKMTLDNAEKLYNFYNDIVKMADNKFGTVAFMGKIYTLQGQAELTGRQLFEWQIEMGFAEFSAPALDDEGVEYTVYWVLQCHDVEDLSDLNWDVVDRVEAL